MAKKQLHATIEGRVQGVGFRAWTQRNAHLLGITGWVRNRYDRTVELTAQGDEAVLKHFEKLLYEGPSNSRVDQVLVTWSEATESFNDFEIVY